jgi:hypothetical protein
MERLAKFYSLNNFYLLTEGSYFNKNAIPEEFTIGSHKHAILINSDNSKSCQTAPSNSVISETLILSSDIFGSSITSSFDATPISLTLT